ncbi:MAG: FkbM family methyltransferase [Hyphomicrobiaceae bacterium]
MLSKVKSRLRRILWPPLHKATTRHPYVFLGTNYGGWPLLETTPRGALLYSFGVGEDISFDLAAIKRFECQVHAFDPTPKSMRWVAQQFVPPSFSFHAGGLAAADGEAAFAPPLSEGYVSFSSVAAVGQKVENAITAPVRRLKTHMESLGTREPDIIKMDIEGFEYEVIEDLMRTRILPRQLLVEFHHNLYGFQNFDTMHAVDALMAAGYDLFYISSSGREYGFCL